MIPFSERRALIDTFGSISDTLLSRGTSSPIEYNLTGEGERSGDQSEAFSVNCSEPGVYLLRTHSYGRYDGTIWHAAQDYTGRWNSMEALGRTQSGERTGLFIRYAYMTERVTPYAFVPDDEVTVEESYVRANGRTAYTWTILTDVTTVAAKASADEEQYYRFAISHYTMPDGTLKQRLLSVYEQLYKQKFENESEIPPEWLQGVLSSMPDQWLVLPDGSLVPIDSGIQTVYTPENSIDAYAVENAKNGRYL